MKGGLSVKARNLEFARSYLGAIESGVAGETLGAFFAFGVEFVVFRSPLLPKGDWHKVAGALEGAERGRELMAGQKYLITNEMAEGGQAALEVEWTGTLAVSFRSLPSGSQRKALLRDVPGVRGGKDLRQRNYDCFERW